MQKIIINGANGYVASHFVSELLKNGVQVFALVRATTTSTSKQRMKNVLTEIDPAIDLRNLQVFNYNLFENDYSLSREQLDEIFSGDIDFFHFAASLKFKKRERNEIFKTNIDGTENSLQVFSDYSSKSSRFFYISTVYSCGKISEPFKETFYENADISHFRNYYEQSKRFAENILRKYKEDQNLNAHIIRLSQVVGDNETGVTKTDYGIFDFIKKLQRISASYPNEKVRIQIDPHSTQNLIPIDNVVVYLRELLQKEDLPGILNFAGREPIKNNEIARIVNNILPVEIIQEKELDTQNLNRKERMIARGMAFTGVYAKSNLKFDITNLEKTISLNGNEISTESLHRMVEFFVNDQFKKNS